MRKRAFNSLPDERVAIVIVESCEPVGESSRKIRQKLRKFSSRDGSRDQSETALRYRRFIA